MVDTKANTRSDRYLIPSKVLSNMVMLPVWGMFEALMPRAAALLYPYLHLNRPGSGMIYYLQLGFLRAESA